MQTSQGGRVLIADDHPLTREGLAMAVRSAYLGATIDTAGSISDAIGSVALRGDFRLILLDFLLPDSRGFSGLMRLQHEAKSTPIAMISSREDETLVEAARALGAVGFLYKTKPLDVLVGELRQICEGKTVFPASTGRAQPATLRDRIESLSGAQLKVLLALADGRLNKQIAADLDISEATVKAHLTAVFRKLGVLNRAQALLMVQPLLADLSGEQQA